MKLALAVSLCVVLILAVVAPLCAAPLYHLTDLGGALYSEAYAISSDGQVSGINYYAAAESTYHVFRWTSGGGMQDLGDLPGDKDTSEAGGINSSGQVVGTGYLQNVGSRAFTWKSATGIQDMGTPTYGSGPSSALGVNNSGQAVGIMYAGAAGSPSHAFLWTSAGGFQDLTQQAGQFNGEARAVNNNGHVTGFASYASVPPSGLFAGTALWSSGTGQIVASFTGRGINDSDMIVGSAFSFLDATNHAYYWTSGGGEHTIGDLPGGANNSEAYGVNNLGQVVGLAGAAGGDHAFLWTAAGGIQDLNSLLDASGAGWTLVNARAINDAGQIVGLGATPGGLAGHAYLLTLVPEPSSAALAAIGVGASLISGIRHHRRRKAATGI